jgi:hypothetical protein
LNKEEKKKYIRELTQATNAAHNNTLHQLSSILGVNESQLPTQEKKQARREKKKKKKGR